MTGKKQ